MEMMFWMMSISMMTFMFMEHPMSMGLIPLTQTILISLMTSLMGINSWFSYILFLEMVGGMLILFTYTGCPKSMEYRMYLCKYPFYGKMFQMKVISYLISHHMAFFTFLFFLKQKRNS